MEAMISARVIVIAGLVFQFTGLVMLCRMLVHAEIESRRGARELEALLDRAHEEGAPPVQTLAS